MACFYPIKAWQLESDEIVFAERGNVRRELGLPCGQCVGCKLERSRQWAMRCMHESQCYEGNSFITLTYDEEHLPPDGGLVYRDFQLFMKRVRKQYGPTRFFMCGEYGANHYRPHFHACLFGLSFEDRVQRATLPSGSYLYESGKLRELWPFGFSSVGDVTFESAAYVARYVLKKQGNDVERLGIVDFSTGAISVRKPEFCQSSRRPGLGYPWLLRFHSDVFPRDYVVVRGVKMRPPRYYDGKVEEFLDLGGLLDFEANRMKKFEVAQLDSTPSRLATREVVTKARLAFKKRAL